MSAGAGNQAALAALYDDVQPEVASDLLYSDDTAPDLMYKDVEASVPEAASALYDDAASDRYAQASSFEPHVYDHVAEGKSDLLYNDRYAQASSFEPHVYDQVAEGKSDLLYNDREAAADRYAMASSFEPQGDAHLYDTVAESNGYDGAAEVAPAGPAPFDPTAVVPAIPRGAASPVAHLGAHYAGEHERADFRGGGFTRSAADGGKRSLVTTQRTSEASREAMTLGAENGQLVRGGAALDTTGAKPGLRGSAPDRMIYALGTDGRMMAEDAAARSKAGHHDYQRWKVLREMQRGKGLSNDEIDVQRPDLANAPGASFFHHSSFNDGADVRAAGDMTVKDGQLKAISNESGHYQPGAEHLTAAMEHLDGMGVEVGTSQVDFNAGPAGTHTGLHGGEFMRSGGNLPLMGARSAMREQLLATVPRKG